MMDAVRLPWPPSELKPNGNTTHWTKRGPIAKKYRADCLVLAREAKLKAASGDLCLHIEFCPPDKRRRDLDNMLASFKQGIDAVAEAMGVDDYGFEFRISRRAPCRPACVVVIVEAL